MTTRSISLVDSLPPVEQGKLAAIRDHLRQNVWEVARYRHYSVHSLQTAQLLINGLSSLVAQLPRKEKLSATEQFLLAAAAHLYDIGMQAHDLTPIGVAPGAPVDAAVLEQIRRGRATLTAAMITESVAGAPDYPALGIQGYDDLGALVAICGVADFAATAAVSPLDLVGSAQVRLQLLAQLLVLADQLFISAERVNVDVLSEHKQLPLEARTRWWVQHYVRRVWIISHPPQIRVAIDIPSVHQDLGDAIRNNVFYECRVPQQSLLRDLNMLLSLEVTDVQVQVRAAKRPLPSVVAQFLRLQQTSQGDPNRSCSLFVDYEGIRIFLGRHGQFDLSAATIANRLIGAARAYGTLTAIKFYADWERYKADADQLQQLNQRAALPLELIYHLEERSPLVEQLAADALAAVLQAGGKHTPILVCSRAGLDIATLQHHGGVSVWADGSHATQMNAQQAADFAQLEDHLGLSLQQQIAWQLERTMLQLIAVIVDHELIQRKTPTLAFREAPGLLSSYPIPFHQWSQWWVNLAVYHRVLQRSRRPLENLLPYDLNTKSPHVQEAFELRGHILETLRALVASGTAITMADLDRVLKSHSAFSNDEGRQLWLTVLDRTRLFQRRRAAEGTEPPIAVNSNHPVIRKPQMLQYLDQLVLTINVMMCEHDYSWLSASLVKDRLQQQRLSKKVSQAVLDLAEHERYLHFERRRGGSGTTFSAVVLDADHEGVRECLSQQSRAVEIMHDWLRRNRSATLDKLEQLLEERTFGESPDQRQRWLWMLRNVGLLVQDRKDVAQESYQIAEANPAIRRILVPRYLNLLLYEVARLTQTGRPPSQERVIKSFLRYVRSDPIIKAAIKAAAKRELIVAKKIENQQEVLDLGPAYASHQDAVDQQAALVDSELVDLLLKQRQNLFALDRLLELMRPHEPFGRIDAERIFWVYTMVGRGTLLAQRRPGTPTLYSFVVPR